MNPLGTRLDDPSGEDLFLSHLAVIEQIIRFVAHRNHLNDFDAEDFASHVRLRLLERDAAILREFRGESSIKTYLSVVIQRQFLDYRTHAWGKWRPTAEARRLGPVAILFEQLTTRDGHTMDEAFEILTGRHKIAIDRPAFEQMAGRLPRRTPRRFESDDILSDVPALERADSAALDTEQRETARQVQVAITRAFSQLPPDDRLLLVMRFEDGLSVAEIAQTLRLDQKKLYRRFDRVLGHLRRQLEGDGVSAPVVVTILEGQARHIDWSIGAIEISESRPSTEEGAETCR